MMHLLIGLLFGMSAAAILVFMWRMVAALRVEADDADTPEEIENTRNPSQNQPSTR